MNCLFLCQRSTNAMLSSPDPPNYPEGDIGSEIIGDITMGGEESEDASADSGDEVPGQINYYQLLPQDISAGENNGNVRFENYNLNLSTDPFSF